MNASPLHLFLPELTGLCAALVLFALVLFKLRYRTSWLVALASAIVLLGATVSTLGSSGDLFHPGVYRVDLFSQLIKIGLAGGLLLVVMASRRVIMIRRANRREMLLFLFLSTVGMMLLASATELLTLYIGLEFSAYPLYIMAALHQRRLYNGEAATKYIMQGAVASAITLYGLSLVFGSAGTTMLTELAPRMPVLMAQPLFLAGSGLLLAGILFKLALFPFHFWAPDVYQATSHQVVTFIATCSKLAAIAVLCRLVALFPAMPVRLGQTFWLMALASMTVGNLAALVQRDFKRLLAYSTVAHAGYVLVGLLAFNDLGLQAALYYGFIYLLMGFACFLVVCVVGENGTNPRLENLAGLYRRAPILALTLLVGLFGLAGIPPTAGFTGKWSLFAAALSRGEFALVLLAAVNSTVALYYYLRVIRYAYLEPGDDQRPLHVHPGVNALALGVCIAIVIAGVWPAPLLALLKDAAALL